MDLSQSSFLTYDSAWPPMTANVKPVDKSLTSQMFYIGRNSDNNTYYIKTFLESLSVITDGSSLTYTSPQTFCWHFIPQGASYVIMYISATGQRLVLGASKQDSATKKLGLFSVADITGPQKNTYQYVWDLTREGKRSVS